jgi:antitoxin (DNA-binding transcriptional repressor) of toxin-antitoxin stability system
MTGREVNCGAVTVTKEGNCFIVTEKDRPVAKIIPVDALAGESDTTFHRNRENYR